MELVAILNITPDSFSDGGKYNDEASILDQTGKFIKNGAAVIDVGAESTRPGAIILSPEQEWQRLESILPQVIKIAKDNNVKVSIDTRHAASAANAIELGIDWINDVSGIMSADMIAAVKNSNVQLVMMHSLSVPSDKSILMPENVDVVAEICAWATTQISALELAGIDRSRIIFDPGLGFGKTTAQSWQLIDRIDEFKSLGQKILVGHSRKSFLGGDLADRDARTLEVSAKLTANGVDYLRVHDIESHRKL